MKKKQKNGRKQASKDGDKVGEAEEKEDSYVVNKQFNVSVEIEIETAGKRKRENESVNFGVVLDSKVERKRENPKGLVVFFMLSTRVVLAVVNGKIIGEQNKRERRRGRKGNKVSAGESPPRPEPKETRSK